MIYFLLLSVYSDVNECNNATLNLCTNPDTCLNTNGSYVCSCEPGFKLEDDQRTCTGMMFDIALPSRVIKNHMLQIEYGILSELTYLWGLDMILHSHNIRDPLKWLLRTCHPLPVGITSTSLNVHLFRFNY